MHITLIILIFPCPYNVWNLWHTNMRIYYCIFFFCMERHIWEYFFTTKPGQLISFFFLNELDSTATKPCMHKKRYRLLYQISAHKTMEMGFCVCHNGIAEHSFSLTYQVDPFVKESLATVMMISSSVSLSFFFVAGTKKVEISISRMRITNNKKI